MSARMCLISSAVLVGVATVEMFVPQAALAADGKITADTDILGLKLSMSQSQARDFIVKNLKRSPVEEPVVYGSQNFQGETSLGVFVDATEQPTSPKQSPTTDLVAIAFNPNKDQTDIFSIMRYVHYDFGLHMTPDAVIGSLEQKYGKGIVAQAWGSGGRDFFWGDNVASKGGCGVQGVSYEDGLLRANTKGTPQNFFGNFMHDMRFGPKPSWFGKPSHCGAVLSVRVAVSGGYVYELNEKLLNVGRMQSELTRFYQEYAAKAAKADADRMKADSQTKPKL